jgi:hypothetical protein
MEMEAARRWRRSRELETISVVTFLLRAVLCKDPPPEELLKMFAGYEVDK